TNARFEASTAGGTTRFPTPVPAAVFWASSGMLPRLPFLSSCTSPAADRPRLSALQKAPREFTSARCNPAAASYDQLSFASNSHRQGRCVGVSGGFAHGLHRHEPHSLT